MNEPNFSICIPNFNYGKYIGETIQSVLDQTYRNFEIVVVDNASTDDSVKVVESFGSDRIRLYRNRLNVGFAPNLQRATERARNDFIILLSSDDLMNKDALQTYAEVLARRGERAQNSVLYAAVDVVGPKGELRYVHYKPRSAYHFEYAAPAHADSLNLDGDTEVQKGVDVLHWTLKSWRAAGAFCATCYPRRLWEQVEGYDVTYHLGPDSVFLHKLLSLNCDYIYVAKRLFRYRVHTSNQASTAAAQGALRAQLDGYLRTINYPNDLLSIAGVTRDSMRRTYIERMCAEPALSALADGRWLEAFRMFSFGLATHPSHAVRSKIALAAAGALALGPVGTLVCRAARRARQKGVELEPETS
jgi:glycosyltransferase involved in cell wall biosynthesis